MFVWMVFCIELVHALALDLHHSILCKAEPTCATSRGGQSWDEAWKKQKLKTKGIVCFRLLAD